jgi:hypothetical protein
MIRSGFLDSESRRDLIDLARDGSIAHRLGRRANAPMHNSLAFAAIVSAIANAMVDVLYDDDVQTIRRLAADIRRSALV